MALAKVYIDRHGRRYLRCSNCNLHPVDWPKIRKKRGFPKYCPRCHAKIKVVGVVR